jgi:hypothetical protein
MRSRPCPMPRLVAIPPTTSDKYAEASKGDASSLWMLEYLRPHGEAQWRTSNMPKLRTHNEWFKFTKYSICTCGSNKRSRTQVDKDPTVYSWGEYHNARWRTVQLVCEICFASEVIPRLVSHAGDCGCTFQLCAKSGSGGLASWIKMPVTCQTEKVA